MNYGKRAVLFLLALMVACACLSGLAEDQSSAQPYIERLVISYAARGERDADALGQLASVDPVSADQWTRIMDLWEAPVTVNDVLPEDMPRDDYL